MHVKPPARAHTVTPHCGSHCHQLHVYLTLQFLCARAPGHVAGSDAHRHGAVREPAALLLRRGHTRAAQGAQILKQKLSRSNPIIAFLLSGVRIAQPDRGARNQRRRPFPRSCTMIFVAMLRILRARGGGITRALVGDHPGPTTAPSAFVADRGAVKVQHRRTYHWRGSSTRSGVSRCSPVEVHGGVAPPVLRAPPFVGREL